MSITTDGDSVPNYRCCGILVKASGIAWDLDQKFVLTRIPEGKLWARGSGMEYAIGAAYALKSLDRELSANDIVKIATEAAIASDIYCSGNAVVTTISSTPV